MIIIKKQVVLTTEVLYYLPDYPSLVQTFMFQKLDVLPELPRLHSFLNFWKNEIDAIIKDENIAYEITGYKR
jgi:uncharacterized protein Usg